MGHVLRLGVVCSWFCASHAWAQADPKPAIVIVDDPARKPLTELSDNRLCPEVNGRGGQHAQFDKTIAEILGPAAVKIHVHYFAPEKTVLGSVRGWKKFESAQNYLVRYLDMKPEHNTYYRYEPWAGGVPAKDFIATVHFKNGARGLLRIAGVYVCFPDQSGDHWWARMQTVPPNKQ